MSEPNLASLTRECDFSGIGSGPFDDYAADEAPDDTTINKRKAEVVLDNFVSAALWGLPKWAVIEMLEGRARTLRYRGVERRNG